VPGWASDAALTVNGERIGTPDAGSYALLDRAFAVGDTVVLDLPMPVRVLRAHRLAEEATNQVAVQRGPVVYCLESADLPDEILLEQAALRRGAAFRPVEAEIAGHRVVTLETDIAVLPAPDPDALYAEVGDGAVRTASVRLVPYFAWGNRGAGEMSVWLPFAW
jgi:DUF1680 family protein